MTKKIKNFLTTLGGTILGIALMLYIYKGFDFQPIGKLLLEHQHLPWIVLTLLVGVLANLFRAFRWRMLLKAAEIPIGKRRAVELVFISYLINSITPRLGELTRSLLVRKGNAEASTRAFGTVVTEKLSDVACLILVVAMAVALRWKDTVDLVGRTAEGLHNALPSYSLFIIIVLIVCLAIGLTLPRLQQLRLLFGNLWKGIAAIGKLESPLKFILLCGAIWCCNFLQLYLLIPCFEELSGLSGTDALYLFAAASIGVLLPTPSGAGPWHFAIVRTLTTAYSIPSEVAKSFALITHGLKTALVMILGILAYITFYWEIWTHRKLSK